MLLEHCRAIPRISKVLEGYLSRLEGSWSSQAVGPGFRVYKGLGFRLAGLRVVGFRFLGSGVDEDRFDPDPLSNQTQTRSHSGFFRS